MASYSIYDPNKAREDGMARLMMLADARRKYNEEMRAKAEAEMAEQKRAAEAAQWDDMGSTYSTAATGAMIGGSLGGPQGALIGGGAGYLLGGASEAYNRYKYKRDVKGDRTYGVGDALYHSYARLPTQNELGTIGGAGMAMGAGHAAKKRATQSVPYGNPNAGYTGFHSNQSDADQLALALAEEEELRKKYADAFQGA